MASVSFLDTGEERRGGQCLSVSTQEREEEVVNVSLLGHRRGKKRWSMSLC